MQPTEQIKNINETIGNINNAASAQGIASPIKPIGDIIGSQTLSSQPEFTISAKDTDIAATKGEDFSRDLATDAQFRKDTKDQFVQNLEQQKSESAAASESSFDDYINNILTAPTFNQIQAEEYKRLGVDEKQLQVDMLDTQLLSEQDALRTKIERIERAGGGLKMGAQADIANLERESYAKQADIALKQLAAQDQLDYATSVADRAVDAMFDRQEKINTALEKVYNRNKDLYDKSEQRLFETNLADRNRKLEQEKEDARLLQQTKIDALKMAQMNQAPQAVIDSIVNAQSPEDVLGSGGQYVATDILDRQLKAQQLSNAVKQGRAADYELAQLSAAEERRNAAIEAGELLPEDFELVDDIDADFRKEPIVKEFNEAAAKRYAFEDIINNGVDGVQDILLVYEFMKAIDPTSVVRESEFETASKSGNIFDGAFAKFNKGYLGEGGFMPAEVKATFLSSANSAWSGKQQQYFNVKEEFGQKVDRRLGTNNGANYLTSYEDAAPLDEATSIEAAKTGQTVVISGIRYLKLPDGSFKQITD